MNQVLDYSAGFPGARAIKQAGYDGAVRYIGFPDRGKCTTRTELLDFAANDLGMALVFENNTTDWRGGFGTGQTSGRRARDHANAIGFPADRPIYMAVDQDVVTSGEFATMIEYLRGAGTSLGGAQLTGVYGEADVIDRARDAGVASWFWQTAAWSRGRRTKAHLFQRIGTVNVGGVGCDVNDVLEPDWGQAGGVDMGVIAELQGDVITGPDGVKRGGWDHLKQGVQWANEAVHAAALAGAKVDALGGTLTNNQAALLAAISDQPTQIDLTTEQMQMLLGGVSATSKQALRELLKEGVDHE